MIRDENSVLRENAVNLKPLNAYPFSIQNDDFIIYMHYSFRFLFIKLKINFQIGLKQVH